MSPFLVFVGALVVAFSAGVVLSQKLKDWAAGVPSSLRGDLNLLQAHVVAQVSAAQKQVVADIHAAVVPQTPVLSTAKPALAVVSSSAPQTANAAGPVSVPEAPKPV